MNIFFAFRRFTKSDLRSLTFFFFLVLDKLVIRPGCDSGRRRIGSGGSCAKTDDCLSIYVNTDPGITCITNNYTPISFSITGGLLPVELISFSGKSTQNGNQLQWRTATELNNAGFEIQKSKNGKDWQIIEFVSGQGTTNEVNEYKYQDSNPFFGLNYYRLKQIDYDGAFEYSKVIVIEYESSGKNIQVFPNPSSSLINIQIDNPSNQSMKIKITDNIGRIIWESSLLEDNLNWTKEIEFNENGIYFITALIGNKVHSKRVVVINKK